MQIKFIEPDGTTRVYGDISHYIVTQYRINESGKPDMLGDSSTAAYVRMFRGSDVNTYGPFDHPLGYFDHMYAMNETGKTVDSIFGSDQVFSTKTQKWDGNAKSVCG